MQYRKFGKLDWQVSILGFGAMRLPLIDQDMAHVNESETIRMIRYAVDHGVNYIDTAAPYHGGNSEKAVGQALKDGYRQKVKLATKLSLFAINAADEFEKYFAGQLERLQTDKIDYYLIHGIDKGLWNRAKDWKAIQFIEKKMAAGQIGHIGFSFHEDISLFKEIVDYYDNWTFCQVQYNYMDVDIQAGVRGVKYASEKGLAVLVMEPVRGGQLSQKPPEEVAEIWKKSPRNWSLAEWAFNWVWNQPEITMALSGMTTMEQVKENVAIADRARVGMLNSADLALLDKVRQKLIDITPIPCTGCRYCFPCPNGVEIPFIFGAYNEMMIYKLEQAIRRYQWPLKDGHGATACQECLKCVEVCPQKIDIPEKLKIAHQKLIDSYNNLSN